MHAIALPVQTLAMTLEHLRLRNTQELMEQVAARTTLDEDSVTFVLIDRPATRQRILAVRRLEVPAAQDDWDSLRDLVHDEMQQLPVPRRTKDACSIVVTIIGRRGFNVWTRTEKNWAMAWRYSNHFTDAFDEDIIVVTEHGWASLQSHAAGHEPRLVNAA